MDKNKGKVLVRYLQSNAAAVTSLKVENFVLISRLELNMLYIRILVIYFFKMILGMLTLVDGNMVALGSEI